MTERPIIGILAQEASDKIKKCCSGCTSYIAASYVKAVESSGARVVPIFLDKDEEYYRNILQSINGLVMPGGNTWFFKDDNITPKTGGYVQAAEILYNEIKKMNEENTIFPILGICLGMEVMLFIDIQKKEYRKQFDSRNVSYLPLHLEEDIETSHLFQSLEEEEHSISKILKEPVNPFSHIFYIEKEDMNEWKFDENWTTVATAEYEKKIEFISIIHSKKYPFLGLQFHPEKIYEWKKKRNIHSRECVKLCRCIFDWLIKMSKFNKNKFLNEEVEKRNLIHNYSKIFPSNEVSFDEVYPFDEKIDPIIN